jgi:hypothetical protein
LAVDENDFAGIEDGVVVEKHRHSCLCPRCVQGGALEAVAIHEVVEHLLGGETPSSVVSYQLSTVLVPVLTTAYSPRPSPRSFARCRRKNGARVNWF